MLALTGTNTSIPRFSYWASEYLPIITKVVRSLRNKQLSFRNRL